MTLEQTETSQTQTRPRGRPMSQEAGKAILGVTRELLKEIGYASLTIEAIAERAGVGKSTVYRRYPSKADVVFAALGEIIDQSPSKLMGKDFAEDLQIWVSDAIRKIGQSPVYQAMPGLLADCHGNPALLDRMRRIFFGQRRQFSRTLLTNAIAEGRLRADVDIDTMADMVIGAVHYRILFTGRPTDRKFVRRIVDYLLKGVAA
jgi:AcrR family transcriptional regulator